MKLNGEKQEFLSRPPLAVLPVPRCHSMALRSRKSVVERGDQQCQFVAKLEAMNKPQTRGSKYHLPRQDVELTQQEMEENHSAYDAQGAAALNGRVQAPHKRQRTNSRNGRSSAVPKSRVKPENGGNSQAGFAPHPMHLKHFRSGGWRQQIAASFGSPFGMAMYPTRRSSAVYQRQSAIAPWDMMNGIPRPTMKASKKPHKKPTKKLFVKQPKKPAAAPAAEVFQSGYLELVQIKLETEPNEVLLPDAGPQQEEKSDELCYFYTRFGTCLYGEECFFQHNPKLVTLCDAFLKGRCGNVHCLLRHEQEFGKLPVCHHFLSGNCMDLKCPYPHCTYPVGAPICQDFQRGDCSLEMACPNIHTYVCAAFYESGGFCPTATRCPFVHPMDLNITAPLEAGSSAPHPSTRTPCKYWQRHGLCKRGNHCFYLHDNPHTHAAPSSHVQLPTSDAHPIFLD